MLDKRYGQVASPFRHLFVWRQDRPLPASCILPAHPVEPQRYRSPRSTGTLVPSGWPQFCSFVQRICPVLSLFRNSHTLDTPRDYFVA